MENGNTASNVPIFIIDPKTNKPIVWNEELQERWDEYISILKDSVWAIKKEEYRVIMKDERKAKEWFLISNTMEDEKRDK